MSDWMQIEWVDGFEIRVTVKNGEAVLSANREGLLSLARQLAMLAEQPAGSHIHYDEYNSLEDGSAELTVEKTEDGPGGSAAGKTEDGV